jgi:ATP-dependent 26S proteasome regulatory subunit
VLEDGTTAYPVVPKPDLIDALRQGDRVLLESNGRALLRRAPQGIQFGEEAQLERRLDARHVEVCLRGQDRYVLLAGQRLLDKLDAQEAAPGATLVVNLRQAVAWDALQSPDQLSHYRFLCHQPVPDVQPERDIGDPPACIDELTEWAHMEMTRPEHRRRYGLRRCLMKLFCGVSGSGKTLAIQAIWRNLYETMARVTGVPTDQLPPRVFRLNLSRVLSMWLGESDKNLDRFFSEVEQMAEEPFTGPDGRPHQLPVMVILEEIDGLARARGSEPVYDRILTTALQRLDPTREELKNKFILYIATTNEPQQVDRAFIRRIGGTIERFGRLKQRAFRSVLRKHLHNRPLSPQDGETAEQTLNRYVAALSAWLFSPNNPEPGLVEIFYAGTATPEVRYKRDFLTGALVDRAVQQASNLAAHAETETDSPGGITLELLIHSLETQLGSVADQIHEQNVAHYLTLPDGVRIANVRRIPQPSLQPINLQHHQNL